MRPRFVENRRFLTERQDLIHKIFRNRSKSRGNRNKISMKPNFNFCLFTSAPVRH